MIHMSLNMFSKIEEYFEVAIVDRKYAGVAFGTIEEGILQTKAIGYFSMPLLIPLTIDNTFEIASITKTFTALVIVCMHLEKRIDIDDEIGKYLSHLTNENVKKIRIRELLNHMSGLARLPKNNFSPIFMNPYNGYSESQLIEELNSAEVGEKKYLYSNLGFAILGYIITKLSSKSFEEVVRSYVLTPLNMTNTFIDTNSKKGQKLTHGHLEDLNPQMWWEDDIFIAAGGMKSDVKDLLVYAMAFLRPESTKLCEEVKFLMREVLSVEDYFVGLSWGVHQSSPDTFSHGGATYGSSSLIIFSREKEKAMVILTNTGVDVNEGYKIFNGEFVEYLPVKLCDEKRMEGLCGTYFGIIEGEEFKEVVYISHGKLFARPARQLPCLLHYLSGDLFSCLNGEVLIEFDSENNLQTFTQNEKTHRLMRISLSVDTINW